MERTSLTASGIARLHDDERLHLYLHPIRIWSEFQSRAFVDEGTQPPCRVVFFPVAGETSTALLETQGVALMDELNRLGPCTLATWGALTEHADRVALLETVRDLAEMGLVAIASQLGDFTSPNR